MKICVYCLLYYIGVEFHFEESNKDAIQIDDDDVSVNNRYCLILLQVYFIDYIVILIVCLFVLSTTNLTHKCTHKDKRKIA